MSVIVILIISSLLVALLFLGAFIWAANSGQFDDTHGPSVRMLLDNKARSSNKKHDGLGQSEQGNNTKKGPDARRNKA